jgi:hypothetical protein
VSFIDIKHRIEICNGQGTQCAFCCLSLCKISGTTAAALHAGIPQVRCKPNHFACFVVSVAKVFSRGLACIFGIGPCSMNFFRKIKK